MKIDPIPDIAIDSIPQIAQKDFSKHIDEVVSKRSPRRFLKTGFFVLALLVLFNVEHISNFHTVMSFDGDHRIVTLADEAGLNLRGKTLLLSKSPELVSANDLHRHCPRENVIFGCYKSAENKIYILEIPTHPYSQSTPSTIAHEMLHVAWEELSSDQRNNLTTSIDNHLAQKADSGTALIKEALRGYENDREVQINEAYAFIGSELSESHTDDVLDDHYRRYFADRNESANAQSRFIASIDSINQDLENRRTGLEAKLQELYDYEARWITPFEYAFQRDLYYGNYHSYNANIDGYNSNIENYNKMLEAYEQERIRFNGDIDTFNSAMAAMEPDRQIQALDSSIE